MSWKKITTTFSIKSTDISFKFNPKTQCNAQFKMVKHL